MYLEGSVEVPGVAMHDEQDHSVGSVRIVIVNEGTHQVDNTLVLR